MRWLAAIVAMVALVVWSLAITTAARATTYSPALRWAKPASIVLIDATGGTQSDYPVLNAVRAWNARTNDGMRISFGYNTSTAVGHRITVKRGTLASPTVGLARYTYSGSTIIKCDVTLSYAADYSGTKSMEIALHEIGHCLGLAHTTRSDSVMNSVVKSPYSGYPTAYDFADIKRLYPGTTPR